MQPFAESSPYTSWSFVAAAKVLIVVTLAGCSGGAGDAPLPNQPQNPRPQGSPDIVVLSVSGRCGLLCSPPEENIPYLGDPGNAAEAIMLAFQNSGATVEFEDYIAALYDYDDNADGQADRFGFLALVDDIQWVFDNWIDGFDNPTRIVVVAHSHGCVWAHIATSVLPQVPIDYLISLDGNCFTWQRSYGPEVFDYLAANGNPYTWDISDPCDVWPVSGLVNLADTEDVVFSNVLVNIEVRSADFLVFDAQINYRLDGTRLEIYTYDAMFDNHSGVYDPSGESMLWVLSQLAALGH